MNFASLKLICSCNILPRITNYSLFILMICGSISLDAQSSITASQDELKAAFTYNFLKFITLPLANKSSDIKVCVADGAIYETMYSVMNEHKIGDKPIKVSPVNSLNEAFACHLIFIATDSPLTGSLGKLSDHKILTVGENEHFISSGGMINFFVENGHLRFEIALASLHKANIEASSRLLAHAKITDVGQ